MTLNDLIALARPLIEQFNLFEDKRKPLAWFLAWCDTESALNQYAIRYEPKFRWLYPADNKPKQGTTEWFGQKTSWGLLQIMGAVARERMFDSKYLSELCDPQVNLKIASEYLAELRGRSDGTWEGALAAYNGGLHKNRTAPYRNQEYVSKVEAKVGRYERFA